MSAALVIASLAGPAVAHDEDWYDDEWADVCAIEADAKSVAVVVAEDINESQRIALLAKIDAEELLCALDEDYEEDVDFCDDGEECF